MVYEIGWWFEDPTLQAYRNYKGTDTTNPFVTEMVNICAKSIEDDGVDAVVLGCGSIK